MLIGKALECSYLAPHIVHTQISSPGAEPMPEDEINQAPEICWNIISMLTPLHVIGSRMKQDGIRNRIDPKPA
jgi:hypothetical protein